MVPPRWQHPTEWGTDWRTGQPKLRFIALLDGDYEKEAAAWEEKNAQWERGFVHDWSTNGWTPKGAEHDCSFEQWHGARPKAEHYMPVFESGTATHLMMYETTSEGTPISPAFATPEELARWLADNNASAFGGEGASYEAWLNMARGGWAPSAVLTGGHLISGVEALAKLDT
jgi:hypothetical protein